MLEKAKNKFKPVKNGLCVAFRSELSLKIQVICFLLLILTVGAISSVNGATFSVGEISLLLMVSFLVIAGELFNTAIEKLIDYLHPEKHPEIAKVKDISASAVFVLASLALIIGLLVLVPKLINLSH